MRAVFPARGVTGSPRPPWASATDSYLSPLDSKEEPWRLPHFLPLRSPLTNTSSMFRGGGIQIQVRGLTVTITQNSPQKCHRIPFSPGSVSLFVGFCFLVLLPYPCLGVLCPNLSSFSYFSPFRFANMHRSHPLILIYFVYQVLGPPFFLVSIFF